MIAEGRSIDQIRERVRIEFDISPKEMARTLKNGVPVWHNRIAWAFSHLVTGNEIRLKNAGVYKIMRRGTEILRENPSELTIKAIH
jgi:restriction endonuclease Mrr